MSPIDKPELRKDLRRHRKLLHSFAEKESIIDNGDFKFTVRYIGSWEITKSQMKQAKRFIVTLDRQLDISDIDRRMRNAFKNF